MSVGQILVSIESHTRILLNLIDVPFECWERCPRNRDGPRDVVHGHGLQEVVVDQTTHKYIFVFIPRYSRRVTWRGVGQNRLGRPLGPETPDPKSETQNQVFVAGNEAKVNVTLPYVGTPIAVRLLNPKPESQTTKYKPEI